MLQVLWFLYNDQADEVCFTCGHTKGVVAGDEKGGIWLSHSIPHLIGNAYPHSGLMYGQSAICISLPAAELNSVGMDS